MITPFIIFPVLRSLNVEFPISLFVIVPVTTLVWLIVTFLTKPTSEEVLISFYRKIHPGGVMWKRVAIKIPDVEGDTGFLRSFINWLFGVILVYSFLFGTGKLIFGEIGFFIMYLIIAIISIYVIYRNLSRTGWKTVIK
jgi:hypothetical protein